MKALLIVFALLSGCYVYGQTFAKGADIGWLSEMEDVGRKFYNDNGVEQDVLDILSDHCINSIRLRVWVDPENWGSYSGKEDVLAQAKRAWDKGFRIMIDFHYSDNWADPGKQYKPAAWSGYNASQLSQAIYDHTYDVLNGLKVLGVTPEWVQIGNETNDGMLWEDGRASAGGMANYANFVTSGHNAAKAVFPNITTIVHVANGWDNGLFQWNIGGLVSNGAQFDAIGMSLYPEPTDWQTMTSNCLSNMQDMVARYGKSIMISEIGMSWDAPMESKAFVEDIIAKNQSLGNKGLGVFWWEPQSYDWNGYTKGTWNPNTRRPTIALDGFSTNCVVTDCNGIPNGTAYYDACGTCVGGNTGKQPCAVDCNGDLNGSAYLDDCGICVGGATGLQACETVDVTFTVDMTGVDVSSGVYVTGDMTSTGGNWSIVAMSAIGNNTYSATFTMQTGDEGGYYYLNANDWNARETVPAECIGYYNSDRGYLISSSNITFSDTWSSCNQNTDCNGTPNGTAYLDDCGTCVGGTTGLQPCVVSQITLTRGWNILGCTLEGKTPIEEALSGIWSHVQTVKNADEFYLKGQDDFLNSLRFLQWGYGYLIKVDDDCILEW